MNNETNLHAKISFSGDFECRDKDGVLLKTIRIDGSIPLGSLVETIESGVSGVQSQTANAQEGA